MKTFTRKITLLMTLVALLLGAASCMKKGASSKPSNVDYYTCTMHPSVKSQDPKSKCPICGMDLVPVKKKGAGTASPMDEHAAHTHGGQMENMPGMPKEAGTNTTEQPTEFIVPVERQQQI